MDSALLPPHPLENRHHHRPARPRLRHSALDCVLLSACCNRHDQFSNSAVLVPKLVFALTLRRPTLLCVVGPSGPFSCPSCTNGALRLSLFPRLLGRKYVSSESEAAECSY